MQYRLRVGLVLAFGILVLSSGCARKEAPGVTAEVTATLNAAESTAVVYPEVVDSEEGSAPVLAFREYLVPAMGELEGYGDRFATIKYVMQAAGEPTTLYLLDFETGTSKLAVPGAVGFKNGYDIVGVSGGDRWVAWEEINGGDGMNPTDDQPTWKLYAARIDAASMTCGAPVLVDEGELETRSRPLFRVEGDSLYWMTNAVADGSPADPASGALVKVRDLASGTGKTVCETKQHYATMSVGDGKVVVTEESSDSEKAVVRVFDPVSGVETWSLDLRNAEYVAHFPQVHDGCIAWTVFAPGALGYPDLFYRGTDGITHRVRNTTSDPIQVGRYVFYDGLRVVPRGSGGSTNLTIIGGYDPATNETFTIIEGDPEDGVQWLMPMGRGYSRDTFVISNDGKPSGTPFDEYSKFPMRIRRYTVPAR
jgi:hypothetical protein